MSVTIAVDPGQGGVRDFSDKLAKQLNESGETTKVISWGQSDSDNISEQIAASDCIYLQYSGYGYAKRGAPLWLLKELQAHRSKIETLGIFFHELYAFGLPWSSAFWLSPVQRHISKGLAELSDFWITNRQGSAQWLSRYAGDKPHAVLPVFSNVGEMPEYSAVRVPKIIVFGGSALRLATYQAAGDELFAWASRQNLEIHDIGPVINDTYMVKKLENIGVIVHGRLPENEISHLLADAMFGLVAYPLDYIAKSGVFAAYCAHGICPVVLSQHYADSDSLKQNQHLISGIPNFTLSSSFIKEIGCTAWSWYQHHNIAAHACVVYENFQINSLAN